MADNTKQVFNKIYYGSKAAFDALATRDGRSLYMIEDTNGLRLMYKGDERVGGNFAMVANTADLPNYRGMVVYDAEAGKVGLMPAAEGAAFIPFNGEVTTLINALQAQLTETQKGAGLTHEGEKIGSYVQVTTAGSNLVGAASLADADNKLDAAINTEVTRAKGVEEALAGRLETIEGTEEGSIKKAVADLKGAPAEGETQDYQTLYDAEKAIEAEVTRAEAAEAAALADAKAYTDEEIQKLDVTDEAVAGKVVKVVSEADGKISVTRDYLVEGDVKVVAKESGLAETSLAEYTIQNGNGVDLGATIVIPKDKSLAGVKMVKSWTEEGEEKSGYAFEFTYNNANGGQDKVYLDTQELLFESEFKNGLEVKDGEVSVKKDTTSEDFLSVSEDGIKLSGIQAAINAASAAATTVVDAAAATDANKAQIWVTKAIKNNEGEDGHVEYTVNFQDIASAALLGAATSANSTTGDTAFAKIGSVQTELDATQEGAGLAADGKYIAVTTEGSKLLGATSLADADGKLDVAIRQEITDARDAESVLAGRLETIEGTEEGSIKKAVADLKGAPAEGETQDYQTLYDAEKAIEAEVTRAGAAEDALGERIDNISVKVADTPEGVTAYTNYITIEETDTNTNVYNVTPIVGTLSYHLGTNQFSASGNGIADIATVAEALNAHSITWEKLA